jgi:hypothetical protein
MFRIRKKNKDPTKIIRDSHEQEHQEWWRHQDTKKILQSDASKKRTMQKKKNVVIESNQHCLILGFHPREGPNSKNFLKQEND